MKKKIQHIFKGILILFVLWNIPIPELVAFKMSLSNTVSVTQGRSTFKTIQYLRYMILDKITSTEKLINFSKNHYSPAVKCYSFMALAKRKEKINYLDLINHNLNDKRSFTHRIPLGFNHETEVDEFFISYSINLLSYRDSITLDSLILFSNQKHIYLDYLLTSISPKKEYYKRIKELALNLNYPSAIVGLSKFKDSTDIDLINNRLKNDSLDLYFPLLGVKNFPVESSISKLIEIQQNQIRKTENVDGHLLRALYKALVRFDSQIVKEKLEQLVQIDTEIKHISLLPDSIKVIHKQVDDSTNVQVDSASYIARFNFRKENEYAVHFNLMELRVALLDFPSSTYQYLIKDMLLTDEEIENIEYEIDSYNYE